jgi:hypothetical protein
MHCAELEVFFELAYLEWISFLMSIRIADFHTEFALPVRLMKASILSL